MKKWSVLTLVVLVVLVFIVLMILVPTDKETNNKLKIATTIYPLSDIVKNIAGDNIEVITLLNPGASPHLFEFSPSVLQDLQDTEVIFAIGHGLDDWALITKETMPDVNIVNVDKNIELRSSQGVIDPHYWLSLSNAQQITLNIQEQLSQIDPARANLYLANTQNYLEALGQQRDTLRSQLSSLRNKSLVTLHEAWYYFADDLGLTIAGTFEPSSGEEPTPQFLAQLQKNISSLGVKALFSEPQLATDALQAFLEDNKLKLAILDPLGGTQGRMTYLELMQYNVNSILEALK